MKLRRRRRRPTVSIEDLLLAFDETGHHLEPVAPRRDEPCNRLERAETQNQVRGCIDRLPDDDRFVLVLRDIKDRDLGCLVRTKTPYLQSLFCARRDVPTFW